MAANTMSKASPVPASAAPIRTITSADIRDALRQGRDDFRDMRGDIIFAAILYPVIAIVAATAIIGGPLLPLLFPIIAGIGLLGPIAAVGFYELARRNEAGLQSNWSHFLDVRKRPSANEIGYVALLLIGIFALWLLVAGLLYVALFGFEVPTTLGAFLETIFTTPRGWALIVIGNFAGLMFAALVLAAGTVSLPMLVDCDVSAGDAVSTSLAAFRSNRGPLLRWGVIVAALLVLGSIPLFVGLAVVLPWLGYATWHLYTKLVDREALGVDCAS